MIKKYIYGVTIAAVALVAGSSCSRETADVFDKTPAERLDLTKATYAAALIADGGKWEMEFWANGDMPGYIALMTFNANGSVNIEMYHNLYAEYVMGVIYQDGQPTYRSEVSTWGVLGDDGPVLSLQNYNKVFHIFSDPYDLTWTEANEQGKGFNSDYEFKFMELSEDVKTIRLRGKKSGRTMYLRRLDSSTSGPEYFDQLNGFSATLFNPLIPKLYLNASSGEEYIIKNASTGIFSMYPNPGDEVTQTSTRNILVTRTGIKFMNSFKGYEDQAKFEVKDFLYQDGKLVCSANDITSTITAGPLGQLFGEKVIWDIDKTSLKGQLAEAIAAMDAEFKAYSAYRQESKRLTFTYDEDAKLYAFVVRIKNANLKFYFEETPNGDSVTLAYKSADTVGTKALDIFPSLKKVTEALSSQFTLSGPERLNPVPLTMDGSTGGATMTIAEK